MEVNLWIHAMSNGHCQNMLYQCCKAFPSSWSQQLMKHICSFTRNFEKFQVCLDFATVNWGSLHFAVTIKGKLWTNMTEQNMTYVSRAMHNAHFAWNLIKLSVHDSMITGFPKYFLWFLLFSSLRIVTFPRLEKMHLNDIFSQRFPSKSKHFLGIKFPNSNFCPCMDASSLLFPGMTIGNISTTKQKISYKIWISLHRHIMNLVSHVS